MGEHKASDNLIKNEDLTPSERRESARRAGIASGKARREKKTFKECLKLMMDEQAPEKIRAAFDKNGYDVTTHREAITAAILMGAMQGNPKMVDKAIELLGEDYKMNARLDEVIIQKERLKMDQEKVAIEKAKAEAYLEAIKAQQESEMEDDGFMDAIKGTAKEDWTDVA